MILLTVIIWLLIAVCIIMHGMVKRLKRLVNFYQKQLDIAHEVIDDLEEVLEDFFENEEEHEI